MEVQNCFRRTNDLEAAKLLVVLAIQDGRPTTWHLKKH